MKRVIITGASSGIGRALALELAGRGFALGLCARRLERLEQLKAELYGAHAGGTFAIRRLDVGEKGASAAVFDALAAEIGGFDVLVANAGTGGSGKVGMGQIDDARYVIEVNLIGAMESIDAAACMMKKSGGGHIVGMSSIAAFRGLPGSAAYSASKAGLAAYLEAARGELLRDRIAVTVVSAGYIDTPMNEKAKSRPFLISAAEGARRIADTIENQPLHRVVPGWPWSLVGFAMRHTPDRLWLRLTGRR